MVDQRIVSFLKVYEKKNFTKASSELALTQPAVSKHIRSLEDELGVLLFYRKSGTLEPTREGRTVAKYARRKMSLDHNMRKEIRNMQNLVTSLSVGITHTAESNASTEALANYATAHEHLKLKIISDSTDRLISMIKDYKLDMAIIESRVNDSALKSVTLDTDSLVLAVAPNHPLAGKPSVTIDDIRKEKLIIRSRHSGTRSMFVSSLEAKDIHLSDFNILMEIDNIAAIKDLIRQGFGVSVLARSACEDEWRKGKIALLPIENLSMIREMNLVDLKDYEHENTIRDIISSYRETRNMITGKH